VSEIGLANFIKIIPQIIVTAEAIKTIRFPIIKAELLFEVFGIF
jgi:hypothetical protein